MPYGRVRLVPYQEYTAPYYLYYCHDNFASQIKGDHFVAVSEASTNLCTIRVHVDKLCGGRVAGRDADLGRGIAEEVVGSEGIRRGVAQTGIQRRVEPLDEGIRQVLSLAWADIRTHCNNIKR